MAKMTKKQMETLVDFGYHSLMSEKFSEYATQDLLQKNDDVGFHKNLDACYRNADIAVKAARELGMTDNQIDSVNATLLLRAKYHNEKAAA